MYDYSFDKERCKWKAWLETVEPYRVPAGARYNDIIVPTVDSIRMMYVLCYMTLSLCSVLIDTVV